MNSTTLILAFVLASLLHPFVLLVTGRVLMSQNAGLKQYWKITGVFAIVTVVAVGLLAFISTLPDVRHSSTYAPRRRVYSPGLLMIYTVLGWLGIMKWNATYMFEKEEVDEWPLIIHYALLIAGCYWL